MKFNLTSPCGNCPFRSDHPISLRPGRIEGIAESILEKDQAFPCHKTTDSGRRKNYSACPGSLVFQFKVLRGWNLSTRLAIMLKWFVPEKLNMKAPICGSVAELTAIQNKLTPGKFPGTLLQGVK